jgi:hypothetical protein
LARFLPFLGVIVATLFPCTTTAMETGGGWCTSLVSIELLAIEPIFWVSVLKALTFFIF